MKRSILCILIIAILFTGCSVCQLEPPSEGDETATQMSRSTNNCVRTPQPTPSQTATKKPPSTDNCVRTPQPTPTPESQEVQAQNLMNEITARSVAAKDADNLLMESTADFSIKLLQQTYANEKNTLVSPLSVLTALAMTANGANGDTLVQMEQTLGGLSVDELNGYLKTFFNQRENTDKVKLTVANSIWFRDVDELTVQQSFLQKNADYYGASVYKAPFDGQTLQDINQWVKKNTDGMIENALNQISPDDLLYLINTLVFDGEWEDPYWEKSVHEKPFTNLVGKTKVVEMMSSVEQKYLNDGNATGFVKRYAGGRYSFVALLPNEGVSLQDYVSSLTGEGFRNMFLLAKSATVYADLPKFSYDSGMNLNDALQAMGMKNAFDAGLADFSNMGSFRGGNFFIGNVIHKTFITVDELGTKAGAVTIVAMKAGSAVPEKIYTVCLDRPFVYAIVDNETGVPVFMGTVVDLG